MANGKEWVYYAIAKDILNKDVFVCLFPGYTPAGIGDKVVAQTEDNKIKRIGDIVYKDFDSEDDGLLNAVITYCTDCKPLKAVAYWQRREIEWPGDEGEEDGAPDQREETV